MNDLLASLDPGPALVGYRRVGSVRIAVARLSGPVTRRPRPGDSHSLVALFGEHAGTVRRGSGTAKQVRLLIAPPEAHITLTSGIDSSVTLCWIPREKFAAHLGNRVVTRVDEGAIARSCRAFVVALCSRPDSLSDAESAVCEQLTSGMGVALAVEATQSGASGSAALLDRARQLIAVRCGDPTLGVAEVAKDLAVSPRQLQRAFAEAGSRASVELRRARVELAGENLREHPGLPREQLALRSGFATVQQLRRALSAEN